MTTIKDGRNDSLQDKLNIGIIAYTTFRGGGLMNFLLQAIQLLSRARPNWNFYIIGSISFPEIQQCASDNVKVQFWDDDSVTCWIYRLGSQALKWLGKGEDAGFLLQKRAERYKIPWGSNKKRHALLKNMDVLWLPHYNLSLNRLSLYNELKTVSVPILFTIHDIHPYFYPEDHPKEDLTRFYQEFIPYAKISQQIITHSQYQKEMISEHLNIEAGKIFVTPQPPLIDPNTLLKAYHSENTDMILGKYGINRSFAFYPASTTHSHKNHTGLLKAWAQLKIELGEACPLLVCTGRGNRFQYQRMMAIVKLLHLEQDVIFTGLLNTSTLSILYQSCELVVIPTLYEGAGSGILTDALLVGKPVACSDIPQIKEQLAALGSVSVTLFDPEQISAITKSVHTIINDLAYQTECAVENQIHVRKNFEKMWLIWAEDYARKIVELFNMTSHGEPNA